jgi:hypothetical protein
MQALLNERKTRTKRSASDAAIADRSAEAWELNITTAIPGGKRS